MNIKLIDRGDTGELLLEGRLDSATSPDTQQILDQLSERFDHLVLDMAGLEYISSAGLRVLKHTHMVMRKKNGSLALRNVNKMVMEVFEMTGFVGLLKFI